MCGCGAAFGFLVGAVRVGTQMTLLISSLKVLSVLLSLGVRSFLETEPRAHGMCYVLFLSNSCSPQPRTRHSASSILLPLQKKILLWTKNFKGGRRACGREDKNICISVVFVV